MAIRHAEKDARKRLRSNSVIPIPTPADSARVADDPVTSFCDLTPKLQGGTAMVTLTPHHLELLNDRYCCLAFEDVVFDFSDLTHCPDCRSGVGQAHRKGCDWELCSVCGNRRVSLSCAGCKGHDRFASAWTGEWVNAPGENTDEYKPTMRRPEIKTKPKRIQPSKSLMRYPGGKQKMIEPILSGLRSIFRELSPEAELREPFLGGGSVAIAFLKDQPGRRAWLNDADISLATLWHEVIHRADTLKMLVDVFNHGLSAKHFYSYRKALCSIRTPVDVALRGSCAIAVMKLAVHQLSYSGLGVRAGGPMGGRHQRDPDAIGCRYNADRLCATIDEFQSVLSATRLRQGSCTCQDFEDIFVPGDACFYLDPPYWKAGPDLYQNSFRREDHERLAGLLKRETRPWLLSYDKNPVIQDLYSGWTRIEEVCTGYSINGCSYQHELLITSR
jgi:DNA adenine methylase